MIMFTELNETQKRYVLEVINRFDHDSDLISLDEMKQYHEKMVKARNKGCPKFGYPNWLIKPNNKASKSIYRFPIPTESEKEDFFSGKTERVVNLQKFSPLFKNVIKEYGLKP
jgi:hypothetical protein